jgi:hypothetical protein
VLRLFGSTVQVGPGTAEPVQPKTETIEPRTGLTVQFRKFNEPKLDQGSSSGRFRFGPRFRTEPWQAYSQSDSVSSYFVSTLPSQPPSHRLLRCQSSHRLSDSHIVLPTLTTLSRRHTLLYPTSSPFLSLTPSLDDTLSNPRSTPSLSSSV